ncbi:Cytoplasmic tRNA 2-thiolation protein 2 [Actinomortierella ambigua]|nr:Cytoplasmic tRNA 2-thiolation protein 2 [Actinomortierella ambigua]
MSCSIDEPVMTPKNKASRSEVLAKKGRNTTPGYCFKCKTAKSTIEIRYTEYCKTGLRNSRGSNPTPGDNVLIAFSGGPCSRSLPAEINAKNPGQPKTYNEIHVAHIDESCLNTPLLPGNDKQTESESESEVAGSTMEKAQAIADMYGFPFHGVRIEDIYDPEWTESEKSHSGAILLTCLPMEQLAISGQAADLVAQLYPSPQEQSSAEPRRLSRAEKVQRLQQLLGALTTLTAKETMLDHIRQRLLTKLTKMARCDALIMGSSATKMAIQILELTALGRGYALPHETALVSTWVSGCKTIRPLKDILQRELELFNTLKGIDTIPGNGVDFEPTLQAKGVAKSIGRLTSAFIVGLDKEFPSTAATVCKTAAKLTMPAEATFQNRCPVCAGPVQQGVQAWKRRITVTTPPFSSSSPSPSSSLPTVVDGGCGSSDVCCGSSNSSGTITCGTGNRSGCGSNSSTRESPVEPLLEFSSLLCYGCLTNLRDLDLKQLDHISAHENDKAVYTHADNTPAFVLPPFMTETILSRQGYDSVEAYQAAVAASSTNARDPRDALREQIQEFLIDDSDADSDNDNQ